jgi:DNA-binding transcriptional LysR family regulator
MRRMEIHHARAFVAVAEELHFGRAAMRLQLTQSTLSRSVAQLEKRLQTQLVARTTQSVSLTPAGEALLAHARELIALADRTSEVVAAATQGETGRVKLGFSGPSTNHVVGLLAREIRSRLPGVRLELISSVMSYVGLEQVLSGDLDIALGRWDVLPADVTSRIIGYEQLVLALPQDHPLCGNDKISLKALEHENWVILPSGPGASMPQRLHTLAGRAGFMPKIAHEAPDSATCMVLVASGYGVSLTQTSVQEHVYAPGVEFRELDSEDLELQVRLIWRRDDQNPALDKVLRVSEHIQVMGPAETSTA